MGRLITFGNVHDAALLAALAALSSLSVGAARAATASPASSATGAPDVYAGGGLELNARALLQTELTLGDDRLTWAQPLPDDDVLGHPLATVMGRCSTVESGLTTNTN